ARGARDHAESDHLPEQRPDAPEIAAGSGREDGGDEVSRDYELRTRRDRRDDLRREAREAPSRCRLPNQVERRAEHAWYAAKLASLRRGLDPVATTPEDQGFRLAPLSERDTTRAG